jgi:hypothetical protein
MGIGDPERVVAQALGELGGLDHARARRRRGKANAKGDSHRTPPLTAQSARRGATALANSVIERSQMAGSGQSYRADEERAETADLLAYK